MAPSCIPLALANDASLVGGKAFNLYRLIQGGFNVPKGFVCIKKDTNAETVIYNQLKAPLIVRSSANLEDGNLLSFAGILESFSPIHTQSELHAHIQKIFALKESIKLSEYLRYYNIEENSVNINCIVQEWKKSQWSGVMFTTRKISGSQVCIIEATKRAGGVVSGEGEVVQVIIPHGKEHIGSVESGLPENLIKLLLDISVKVESHFKEPQDVEWVWDGEEVYIVQARPITEQAIEVGSLIDEEIYRLNTSVLKPPLLDQNQFADGMVTATPLTASLFAVFFGNNGSLARVLRKFGVNTKALENQNLVFYVCGRLYLKP